MHELGRFVRSLMEAREWKQADLVRASGLNKGTVSRLLTRDSLRRMVEASTLDGLHRAFPEVRRDVFVAKSAESIGITPVENLSVDFSQLSDEALLGILAERLRQRGSSAGRRSAPSGSAARSHSVDVTPPPVRHRAKPKPTIRFPQPYDPDNPTVPDWAEETAARDEQDGPRGTLDPGQDAAGEENQDGEER